MRYFLIIINLTLSLYGWTKTTLDSIPSETLIEEQGNYYQQLSANNYLGSSPIIHSSSFQSTPFSIGKLHPESNQLMSLDQDLGLSLFPLLDFREPVNLQGKNRHVTENHLLISGGNLGYIGGGFYLKKQIKRNELYLRGYGNRGEEFPMIISERANRRLAETISLSTISEDNFVLTDQDEDQLLISDPTLMETYSNFGIEGGITNINFGNFLLSTQVGWRQKRGIGYQAIGEYFASLQKGYATLDAQFKKFRARADIQYIQSKPGEAYFYQSGKTFSYKSWNLEGEVAYVDTLKRLPISYEIGVNHQTIPTQTNHTLLGRNESQFDYTSSTGFINAIWKVHPKAKISSSVAYGHYDAFDGGGISFNNQLAYQPNLKTKLGIRYQQIMRPPSMFALYADLPVSINNDFDVWLRGNSVSQQVRDIPVLISWTHPFFSTTPYIAGFSIQQAYNYVNEEAKVLVSQRLIEMDPRNRPITGLLNFILTEEFAPVGFVNDFNSHDYLSNEAFNTSLSGTSSARLNRINQFSLSISQKIKKLQFEANIYFIQERNPVQLTMTSPSFILNDLGIYLGQAVQNRIQLPIEELLVSVGGFQLEEAEAKASEIGQVLKEVYTQQGNELLSELDQYPFHGSINIDQSVRQDKSQLMMGYATLEQSEFWGVDMSCTIPIRNFATLSTTHHWVNTSTYTTNKLNQSIPFVYHFNRPIYRTSTSVSFYDTGSWNARIEYDYESKFEANLGVFNGTVPSKNRINVALNYSLKKGIDLSLDINNLFDQDFQSYPIMPQIGRTVIGSVVYRFL